MVRFARLPLSPYQRDIWVAAAQFPELDQYTIFSYDRFTGEVDTQALERALLQAARDTGRSACASARRTVRRTSGWTRMPSSRRATSTCAPTATPRPPCDPGCATPSATPTRWTAAAWWTWPCCIATRRSTSTCAPTISSASAWGLQLFLSRVRAGYLGEPRRATGADADGFLLAQLETDDYSGSGTVPRRPRLFRRGPGGPGAGSFTRRRPAGLRRTARHRLTLERTLLDAIRDRGESPFLFLSAAVALYLARIHQNDDVVLGVPVLNRADRACQASGQALRQYPAATHPHRAGTDRRRIPGAVARGDPDAAAPPEDALGDLLRGASPLFDTTPFLHALARRPGDPERQRRDRGANPRP